MDPTTLYLDPKRPFSDKNGILTHTSWRYLKDLQLSLTTVDLASQVTGILPGTNGGTGHNNGTKTISLGGNFATSGAFNTTLTATANTNVTLPTSGTLLTAANAVTALTGTANQIDASASVGAVTLSLPTRVDLTWFTSTGNSRVSTQFNKTTDVTLANITGLSASLIVGRTYAFLATLYVTADATGGQQYAIAGSAVASAVTYDTIITDFTGLALVKASRSSALATAVALAGNTHTVFQTVIRGAITVGTAGTLTVQFAQNSSSGTSSVLVGSTFQIQDIT